MLGLSVWTAVLFVVAAAALGRVLPRRVCAGVQRALSGKTAVMGVALAGGVLALWLWGSLARTPVVHDESAYLLQAELFARFRWTGAGRPLPEFFEQLHVLVDGVLASKYPPGNSLVLALGVLVGLPGLPIVIMNACAGALMFVLARRAAGGAVALLTMVVWESSFPMLYYHANYMSESASSLAWLVTWWSMVHWRDGDGRKWLAIAGAAVAWCMITRPVTGLALGVVALGAALWRCRATHRWRDLVPALGIGAAILAIVPLWNWRTTGNVLVMPLTYYTKTYVPFDKPGFGSSPDDRPSASLPRDQARMQETFYRDHLQHTVRRLPVIAWHRLTMIDRDMWYEWRGGLRLFAVIGLATTGLDEWILLASVALQFLLYLTYAHPSFWTLYYVEGTPILAFFMALGIAGVFSLFARDELPVGARKDEAKGGFLRLLQTMRRALRSEPGADESAMISATTIVATAGLVAIAIVANQVKGTLRQDHAYYDAFARVVRQIPDQRAVVFVRYGEQHLDGLSLVRNVPDLAAARVWTVYDRGPDNARLIALASDRVPYVFDEATWTLRRLEIASAKGKSPIHSEQMILRERRGVQPHH